MRADPSGKFWQFLIPALIGGVSSAMSGGDFMQGFALGFASAGIGVMAGGICSSLVGNAANTVLGSFGSATLSGGIGGGIINMMYGGDFWTGFGQGALSGGLGWGLDIAIPGGKNIFKSNNPVGEAFIYAFKAEFKSLITTGNHVSFLTLVEGLCTDFADSRKASRAAGYTNVYSYSYSSMSNAGYDIKTGMKLEGKDAHKTLAYLQMLTNDVLDISENGYVYIVKYNDPGSKKAGTLLLRALIDTNKKLVLITSNGRMPSIFAENTKLLDKGIPVNARIEFSLELLSFAESQIKDKVLGGASPPQIILAHELVHAYHMTRGSFAIDKSYYADSRLLNEGIVPSFESQAVGFGSYSKNLFTENNIRREQYYGPRIGY